ncbi:MAG: type III pantothenate kinase [Sulfuriferula sp.]|nr:type III pantothenate kinase [Sulfuriferula sp.]
MNLLAIDAGNTRIKWGLHDGQQWLQRGHIAHDEIARLPALVATPADHIIISNVAGPAIATAIAQAFRDRTMHTVRATERQLGVSNHYDNAAQLGSDRWAALIAAHQLGARTAIIVTAGTALTADALHDGQFLGGIIAPGYQLMQTALAGNTAQLAIAPGMFNPFPTNTADAIASGCLLALIGAIERMAATLQQRTQQPVHVWLNGGDAQILIPHLSLPVRLEDNLVLIGLNIIAQEVFA